MGNLRLGNNPEDRITVYGVDATIPLTTIMYNDLNKYITATFGEGRDVVSMMMVQDGVLSIRFPKLEPPAPEPEPEEPTDDGPEPSEGSTENFVPPPIDSEKLEPTSE